jgi:hypothetical protein
MPRREHEIAELMAVQNDLLRKDREREERIALETRQSHKRDVLSGRQQDSHAATCRYCAGRIVDCLPPDKVGCGRSSGNA